MFELIGMLLTITGSRWVGIYAYDRHEFLDHDVQGLTVYHMALPERDWNGDKVEGAMASELVGFNTTTGGNCGNGQPNAVRLELHPGFRYHIVATRCEVPQLIHEFDIDLRCADWNHDGYVDAIDYDTFVRWFIVQQYGADINCDGFVDAIDLDLFVSMFIFGTNC